VEHENLINADAATNSVPEQEFDPRHSVIDSNAEDKNLIQSTAVMVLDAEDESELGSEFVPDSESSSEDELDPVEAGNIVVSDDNLSPST
jgi:hypothetical protein